ncbi:MAG: GGDEF domain-containing protein [Deltaproteobacteria bacterium]|nr:GGDEF domain-containing protein [Deltaproteobacteria bacterium]
MLVAMAAVIACAVFFAAGAVVGWAIQAVELRKKEAELRARRAENREVQRGLQHHQEGKARETEIAVLIPSIVRRLGERQPHTALPRLAVRLVKEFFKPAQIAFLRVAKDGNLVLTEGVGVPPAWKQSLRVSPGEGILALAMANKVLVLRQEHAALRGLSDLSGLERAGMVPDAVLPVVVEDTVVAVMVVAGVTVDLEQERRYASMLADLIANAFQSALAIETLEQRAMTDPLTGLHNRAYLAERCVVEMRRARSYALPLSFILFDIDHFKSINDRYGHPAGDAVLRQLASFLRDATRSSDAVVRYGGEEFALMVSSLDAEQVFLHADRLRAALESTPFALPGVPEPVRITVSGGVATYPQDGESFSELVRIADAALYHAKETGRNRVSRPRPPEIRAE